MPTHDPLGVIAQVHELEARFRRECYPDGDDFNLRPVFNLSLCGRCRAPVWQQPCPVCNFYPYGALDNGIVMFTYDRETQKHEFTEEWLKRVTPMRETARAEFIARLNRHGNVAAWWLADKRNTVAYTDPKYEGRQRFIERVERFYEEAQAMSFPSAEAIWAAYGDPAYGDPA